MTSNAVTPSAPSACSSSWTLNQRYMLEFLTSMCPHLTYNGQCPGQNGCFHAHSKKMLRRRPILQPSGKWNYWPKFCNAVSSNGGFEGFSAPSAVPCKFGESCQFAHVINEITFHPLVFKTTKCNARVGKDGYCIEKGRFCTKAHEHESLRNPNNLDDVTCLFENGKAQALPPPLTGGEKLKDVDTKSATQKSLSGKPKTSNSDNPPPPSEEHLLTQVCNSAQRDFYQYVYKTRPCKAEACRNCPNYHNPHERRRPLPPEGKVYYTSFPCEHAYDPKLGVWPEVLKCKRGDTCPMAHTKTEGIYHPDKYKTSVCQAFENGNCKWGFACAWAHGVADLNHVYVDDTKRTPATKPPSAAAPSKPPSEEPPPPSKWHVPPQPLRIGPGWPSLGAENDSEDPKLLPQEEPAQFQEDARIHVAQSQQAGQAQPPPYWQAHQELEPMDNYLSLLLSDNLSSNLSDSDNQESYLFHNGIAPLRAPLGVTLDSGLVEPTPLSNGPAPSSSVFNPALDLYLLDALEPMQRRLQRALQEIDSLRAKLLCPRCGTQEKSTLFFPCGHVVCSRCIQSETMAQRLCPYCAAPFFLFQSLK